MSLTFRIFSTDKVPRISYVETIYISLLIKRYNFIFELPENNPALEFTI